MWIPNRDFYVKRGTCQGFGYRPVFFTASRHTPLCLCFLDTFYRNYPARLYFYLCQSTRAMWPRKRSIHMYTHLRRDALVPRARRVVVARLALALAQHAQAVAAAGRVRLAGGRVGRGTVVTHGVQLGAALGCAAVYALPPSVAGAARRHAGRAEERGEGRGVGLDTGADGGEAGGRDCNLLGERQRRGCDRLQAAITVAGARSRARGCISLAAI